MMSHYKNMPMQQTVIFSVVKTDNFSDNFLLKNFDFFLVFVQNIDCG